MLWVCKYQGLVTHTLHVIPVKSILSVVGMVLFAHCDNAVFVVEKLGLEVADLGGVEEELADE
jgi:hypothetical protein